MVQGVDHCAGLPSTPSAMSSFFPPSSPRTMTLPVFLGTLSNLLGALSPSNELLAAFDVFDDDDNGQIDVAELRESLLKTAPDEGDKVLSELEIEKIVRDFSGRRAFGKGAGLGAKKGDVFKYKEFVEVLAGGGTVGKDRKESSSDT
jgi:hypothetical protein